MKAEFLVTGGAGFIGSNLVAQLVRRQRSVRVLDNFLTGKKENLRGLQSAVEIATGDLRDAAEVREAVRGVRYILHLAALPSVPRSVAEPQLSHAINLNGTLNLLTAARDEGVKRLIFSSSSSVYGDTPSLPKNEAMTPCPQSPYAIQKIAGEYYCRIYWQLYGLETISLRYFNVFGPRQDPQSDYAAVIPRFITAALQGRPPVIYGDGKQTRDFSQVDNVVAANLAACEAPDAALGQSFNIACGGRTSLLELIRTIAGVVGRPLEPLFQPARAGDVIHSQADIGRAEEFLGWRPTVTFEEGIARTIHWYREGSNA